jgi:retinol dehydrogenase 13
MSFFRYVFKYRLRDMRELLRNEKKQPMEYKGSLKGKTVVLSGATAGIGRKAAELFASRGASLILLNRSRKKSEELEQELKKLYKCKVKTILVDFSSLAQTKACAEKLLKMNKPIDVLIHNSGVYYTKKTFTEDNIEMVFQVNHLSSFCLNYMLMEKLKQEKRARIIYVNSEGHRFALGGVHMHDLRWKWHLYTGLKSYGAAKTAQLLSMINFNEHFQGSGVTINAMHPGNVVSRIGENNGRIYRWFKKKVILSSAKDPLISAQALLYLAAAEEMKGASGLFYNLTTPEHPAPHARDTSLLDVVWQKSLECCKLQ